MLCKTIVADPPWQYEGFVSYHGGTRRVEKPLPYKALTVEEIASLPVESLADKDCNLFLWTTNRYLPHAFPILEAWGFVYRQTLVWHKTGNPSPFGGVAAPHHAEFLLLAQRGNPKMQGRLKGSVVEAPAVVKVHSSKPEVFLDHIENISEGPYLELFARRAGFGWEYWGDQSLNTLNLVEKGEEE